MAKKKKTSKKADPWREILKVLPGYDPYAHSDGCWFDPDEAQRAIDFCETCIYITEGDQAGTLFKLSAFQKAIVANLCGWKMKNENGQTVRRYREMLLYIPRGNGKTVFAAVLTLLFFFLDVEAGAQLYCAGNTKEQATLLYRHAKGMIEKAPALKARCKSYDASKTITLVSDPMTFLRAIPAEEAPAYGYKTHVALIDELHTQPNRNLVDALTSSMGTRSQPLTIYMTTADYMRQSFCNEVYDRACQVRDNSKSPGRGYADARFLPVVYEALPEDDWTKEETWYKANPNLGISVKVGFLRDEFRKAQQIPAYENTFKRMYLNMRTQSDVLAIPAELWEPCGHGAEPIAWRALQIERMKGKYCAGGIDIGAKNDLTAHVLFFYGEKPKVVLPFFWATEAAVERRRKDRIPYDVWVKQGFLKITPGDTTDYNFVRRDILNLAEVYPFQTAEHLGKEFRGSYLLGVDRLFQGVQFCTDLANEGLKTISFGQGYYSMAMPTRRLLEMLADKEIDHGNNPIMAWMAGNASTESDSAGNLKFSKSKSGDKIDGIIGLVEAIGISEGASGGSVYNERGIMTIGEPVPVQADSQIVPANSTVLAWGAEDDDDYF